tara:strand:+ start:197 stop:766 length:570 start_codon:yes stop_codon:yes gene_type:complete
MALTSLVTAFQGGKDKVGGIIKVRLWEQLSTGHAVTDSANGTVGTGVITDFDLPTTPTNVGIYKFAQGTGKMDVSLSQEKGLALSTISIEGYIPGISKVEFNGLKTLVGKCLMGQVEMATKAHNITNNFLVGWDNVLGTHEGTGDYLHSKFGLFLESVEASSGAVMEDGAGATVKLTAVQGELPYTTEE